MREEGMKLDPEFRQLLLQLTEEYLSKNPEDFVEFCIQFFKKKQKLHVKKVQFMLDEEDSKSLDEGEQEDEDEDDTRYDVYHRKAVYSSFDVGESIESPGAFKTPEQQNTLKKVMQSILFFKALHEEDINILINVMNRKEVKAKEIIIRENDDGDFFYIVNEGKYVAYKTVGSNKKILKTYDNEGYFGELALLYNIPRSCSVEAETDGLLWSLDRNIFRKIVVQANAERRRQYLEFLSRVPMLAGLSELDRHNLTDCLEPRLYSPGSRIIREGETADGMYFLLSGTARVTVKRKSGEGKDIEVRKLEAGDYFGELALVTKKRRAASIYAVTQVNVAFLDSQSFERLLGPCLNIMKRNISLYSEELQTIIDALDD